MFRFTIRELVLLTLVVAIGVGWWIDQDRIRRQEEALKVAEQAFTDEREKFRLEVQRLQTLPLRRAEAALRVAQAEVASLVEMNERNAGSVSQSELHRLEMQLDVARLDMEKARAIEELRPPKATRKPARPAPSSPANGYRGPADE